MAFWGLMLILLALKLKYLSQLAEESLSGALTEPSAAQ